MRGFENTDEYHDWVQRVAEHYEHVPDVHTLARKHVVHMAEYSDGYVTSSAGLDDLVRAFPAGVIRYSENVPPGPVAEVNYREYAVSILAEDIRDALEYRHDPEPEIATVEVTYEIEVRLNGDEDDHEVKGRAREQVGTQFPTDEEIVERETIS